MLKITKPLQFISALGIMITGVTLFSSNKGHAELCDCTCAVAISTWHQGCRPAKASKENECNSACEMTYGVNYFQGSYYCDPTKCTDYNFENSTLKNKKPSKPTKGK